MLAAEIHTIPAATPQAIIFHLWLNQKNCQHQHTAKQGRGYRVKQERRLDVLGFILTICESYWLHGRSIFFSYRSPRKHRHKSSKSALNLEGFPVVNTGKAKPPWCSKPVQWKRILRSENTHTSPHSNIKENFTKTSRANSIHLRTRWSTQDYSISSEDKRNLSLIILQRKKKT